MTQHAAKAHDFDELLHPTRDLAATWNVHVAEILTQYAATLGINLDQTSSPLLPACVQVDFAHAALLVQGSTSIYSRKVEHLYTLVYTALASLNQLKNAQHAAREQAEGPDATAELDDEFPIDELNFLTLDDDCLPQIDERQVTLPPNELPPPGSLRDKTCLKQIPPTLVQHDFDAQPASAKFSMLSARFHPSGALIMPGCPPFDENLQALPQRNQSPTVQQQQHQAEDVDEQHTTQPTIIDFDDELAFHTPPPMAARDDDDEILVAVASSAKKRRSPHDSPVDKEHVEPPKRDPFLLLDPHQKIPKLDKELKVGKTYQKPRKHAEPKPYFGFVDDGMSKVELVDALLGPISRGSSIRSYLCFEGSRNHYQDILKRRMAKKRQRMRANSPSAVIFNEHREAFGDMEEEEDLIEMGVNTVTFDMGDNEEIDISPYPHAEEGEDELEGVQGMDTFANEMQTLADRNHSPSVFQDQLRQLASSYEETCRKYLERTRGLWEQHSVDAKLAKKVESWKSRIHPILDDEEKRPEFDITAYGQRILSQFRARKDKQGVSEMSMSAVFEGCSTYDVCRNFLATLQLANSRSIEIVPPRQCSVSDPKLRLICQALCATTPVKLRSKRLRQPGGTPRTAKRAPLRQRLDM